MLTMDGVGEWATTSVSIGRGNTLEPVREIHWPHSIGLLYSAFTYYTGFKVNSGEYKVMGLAPYGEPRYADLILDNVVDLKEDGSFWLDQSYFNYATGLTMTSRKFHDLVRWTAARSRRRRSPSATWTLPHPCRRSPKRSCCALRATSRRHTKSRISALLVASRSIASPTARFCAMAPSSASGFSRRRVMPVARSAQHSLPITSTFGCRAQDEWGPRWNAGLLSRPRVLPSRDREAARGSGRKVHGH